MDTISGVSVVLPAWDEESTLALVVRKLLAALDALTPNYEIIIVDDDSEDTTGQMAGQLAMDYASVRLIQHSTHQGYGAAWRTGITAATKPYIVLMDADAVLFDPDALAQLVSLGGSYDLAITYCSDPGYQSVATWCLNTVIRLLYGMRRWDCARGFVLGRTALLQQMDLISVGFLLNAEVLYRARKQGAVTREMVVRKRQRYPENPLHLRRPVHQIGKAIILWLYLMRSA